MQRPLKFRAWDKEEKKMWPDMPLLLKTDWRRPTYLNLVVEDMQERFALMQFTGLLDKNGVEIYEGDVLRRSDGAIGVVEWSEKDAGFITRLVKGSGGGYYEQESEEVIGNIYENPELLKS